MTIGHEPESAGGRKRAVLYLRVSSPSQLKTDYNPEGISIPAQRDACKLKCSAIAADIVKEFVEPAEAPRRSISASSSKR